MNRIWLGALYVVVSVAFNDDDPNGVDITLQDDEGDFAYAKCLKEDTPKLGDLFQLKKRN